MDVKKNITASLTRSDVEEAIKDWLIIKGYRATNVEFNLIYDREKDMVLEGATCEVEENRDG